MTPGRELRRDLEGLRAIAIGTVLAFHAGLPFVAGGYVGVDVFFVLSGFLITGLLVREVDATGRVRLGRFWARRARRLLPASVLVLAFSTVVTWAWLPLTQRSVFGGDIASAALYVVNWRLAERSVDYDAEDVGASPVQHFWSLAVEEQFYLVWPLMILAMALVLRDRRRAGITVLIGVLTVGSFVHGSRLAASSPDSAFFASTARIWELGVGALLALGASAVARMPPALRALVGWAGLAGIAVAAAGFDGATPWPGLPALLPVLSAAGVIAAGVSSTPFAPSALLSVRPLVWIGGISYSLYLWHWPLLVAGQAMLGDLRIRHGVTLALIAIVPAWLSRRLVEDPIRFGSMFRPVRRAGVLATGLTVIGLVAGLGVSATMAVTEPVQSASADQAPGARALGDERFDDVEWSEVHEVDRMRPLPTAATEDGPAYAADRPECRVGFEDSAPVFCEFGDTTSARTVVLVGNSKLGQWHGAFADIARDEGWRIVQSIRSGCDLSDAMLLRDGRPWRACRAWGRDAVKEILRMRPDLVVTTTQKRVALQPGGSGSADLDHEAMVEGVARHWARLTDAGIPLVTLLDNPTPPPAVKPVYECVAQHPDDLTRCSFDRRVGIASSGAPTQKEAAGLVPGVQMMDLTDVMCPDGGRCPPVIGNVLVYRQGTHLTNTFVLSARDRLAAALERATDGRFGAGAAER